MSRLARAVPVALMAFLLALTPLNTLQAQQGSSGETSTVTFYGHVFGHGLNAPMPANTEAPVGEDNYGFGSFHWCTNQGSAVLGGASTQGCETHPANKLALFSTAGFVDVEDREQFNTEGAYELLHNERGQTKDVLLDTGQPIQATIYLTVDLHSWPAGGDPYGSSCSVPHPPDVPCVYPYWGWDVGVKPDFVVEATLYSANLGEHGASASEAPPIQEAIDSGDAQVIAQGQWGPEMATSGLPGQAGAQQFTVDLGPAQV
ncbi:MAG: hypothetical protein R3185_09735, partial [Candidatus Thermoplasmatota archaeon]|nr:hypothetical protein [Candidatus Thermoplasmatota archaeon]